MARVSRRRFLMTAASAAVLAPVAPAVVRAQGPIKIGTAVLGDYGLAGPMIVATEKDFFKSQQVNVEFLPFRGGPDLAKGVMSGDVLIGISGATDVLVFREKGSPIKMIASHVDGNHFTLNVAPEVKQVGDLKGKAIGVTAPGSTTWVFARMIAKQQGWNPDKDVQIVPLGGLDAQVAALVRRETAAFVFGDSGAVTELQGKSRVLLRLDRITPKWISMNQYATDDAIRKSAEAIRRAQRAIFQAIKFMKANPKESADLVAKRLGWPAEAVLLAHTKITGSLFSSDGRFDVEALKTMQDTLLEEKVLSARLPLEQHYTTDFTPVRV